MLVKFLNRFLVSGMAYVLMPVSIISVDSDIRLAPGIIFLCAFAWTLVTDLPIPFRRTLPVLWITLKVSITS